MLAYQPSHIFTTIDPLNRTTLIERDPQGNPTKITRPNGAVSTIETRKEVRLRWPRPCSDYV